MAYDIIILAGQSNAEGSGKGNVKNPYIPSNAIWQIRDPQPLGYVKNEQGEDVLNVQEPWEFITEVASERTHDGELCGNFAFSFAQEYVKEGFLEEGRKVLIVNTAVGGAGFAKHHWGVGEVLQRRMMEMIDCALDLEEDPKIVAFLWHQGEHDAFENAQMSFEERHAFYKAKLTEFLTCFREKYHTKIPFIAGEFVSDWRSKNAETCQAVLDATAEVCKADVNADMVSANGLLSNDQDHGGGDDIHFCREALYEFGKRYFAVYKNMSK